MSRILIVEDEESFSDPLSYLLEKEGFEVTVAADGNEALSVFERDSADLILLDLMLPGMSGTEVCRQVRQRSNVPVIMLTAKDSEIDKVVGLELGADDYVTKPFSPREMVARVKSLVRRSRVSRSSSEPVSVGAVSMDTTRRRVWVGDEPVDLTATEFDLLAHLVSEPGRVFSRDQLLAEVWGYASVVGSRTVDVHVAQLRAKLGDDSPIRTVRGVGYSAEVSGDE